MAELPMALTLKNTLVLRNGRNNLYFKCKRNFNVSRKISRLNGVKDFKTCCSSSNSGSRHTKIEENQLVTSRRNLVISSSGIAVTSILSGLPTYAAVTETQQVPALGQITIPPLPSGSSVELSILDKCGLGVSVYPDFVYHPVGGGGIAKAEDADERRIHVAFDIEKLNIPSVEFSTTSLLGVPLPPPLKIDIVPSKLEGYIDRVSGQVELEFIANFNFSAGPLYRAPSLFVETILTTEDTNGSFRKGQGRRLDSKGNCVLAGTARISRVNDVFMDNFLMLPTDVLAVLPANFSFKRA